MAELGDSAAIITKDRTFLIISADNPDCYMVIHRTGKPTGEDRPKQKGADRAPAKSSR